MNNEILIEKVVEAYPDLEVIQLPEIPLQRQFRGTVALRWKKFPQYAFWVFRSTEDTASCSCHFKYKPSESEKEHSLKFFVLCACCELDHRTKAQLLVNIEFLEDVADVCREHGIKTLFTRRAEQADVLAARIVNERSSRLPSFRWEEVAEFKDQMRRTVSLADLNEALRLMPVTVYPR